MRIAVFRALQLGDLLVAVPALRSLRAGYPDAEITLISLPWAATFARRFGRYVDRFVPFPGFPGLAEIRPQPGGTERFLAEQRAEQYDLVIQMHGNGSVSNRVVRALAGARTAGYYEGERPDWLDIAAPYPSGPEVRRNLGLIRLLDCPERGTDLEFPLTSADQREAASLLTGLPRPLIGLHPGARSPARRWPAEHFATAANLLARRHGGTMVLTGTQEEASLVDHVARLLEGPAVSLAGRTSLGGLAAVIVRLDLFLSNSTGPAHIADAVHTPSVIAWGAADPERWAPLDTTLHRVVRYPTGCAPCGHWVCPIDHPCLRLLEPAQVAAAADTILDAGVAVCNA
ncbi:MAG TPA: glycosyltransferase family 9 protein [Chloroflexota bacterium]|nr:glycosyltransferase family 9 protein [Chloroflexota bacterium]